jgi:hypothetical protein
MVTHIQASPSGKPSKHGSVAVLGRSAATGHLVLKPASKSGAVSLKDARAAVASVLNGKKT